MKINRVLVSVLALAVFGLPAMADVVTYCSGSQSSCSNSAGQSAFTAATSNLSTVDFTNLIPDGSGAGFEDAASGLLLDDPADALGNISQSGGVLSDKQGFNITPPPNALVLGFDILLPGGSSGSYSISYTIDGGPRITATTLADIGSGPSSFFFGITSDDPITGLFITGNNVKLTDFELQGVQSQGGGGDASTPEVGTLLLIGAGLIAMRWMHRGRPRFLRTPQTA